MRVAIVHDNLVQFGGAERVLLALLDIFPNAPVYTLLYDAGPDGLVGGGDDTFINATVTSSTGGYLFFDVPPGTYTIKTWHEKYGDQTQQVTVKAGEAASANASYKAGA